MNQTRGDRAVVLGGSMAGLLAASVLADAYGEVLVVERDELPDGATHRRGVPQSHHIHGLLARGQQALEELFEGLTAELVDLGAPAADMLQRIRLYLGGNHLQPGCSGLLALQASRPLLEARLRARALALPGVELMERCDVAGLTSTPDGSRVTGVRVVRRLDGSAEQILPADLVVDATGRGSRTPAWLEMLGHERPPVERVRIGIGYASRTYRFTPDLLGGDLGVINAATPEHPRGGGLAAIEGDRFIVTLYGILGDHPPTDPDGFDGFAGTLKFPDIHEAVRNAEPLDDPVAFRYPASVRHHYQKLSRFPDGLLAMGDAVCTFNPVYGQGMSVVALEALALRDHLQEGPPHPLRFFRRVGRIVDVPWNMATGGDLAFPAVEGRRTLQMRLLTRYLARLHESASRDPRLGAAFLRVAGLVDPPQTLLAPGVAARVLRGPPPFAQDEDRIEGDGRERIAAYLDGVGTPRRSEVGRMGVQELSVWIEAGQEAVWRTYVDPRRIPEWQTGSPRIVAVDGRADEPGSTYVTKRGPTTAHTTVLSVDRHRLLVTRTRALLGLRFDVVSRLQPEGDGTRLDLHVETRWPRGLGWAGRLVELVILSAAEGRKELGNLKSLVEHEGGR